MRNFVRKKNMQQILEKLFKIFVFFSRNFCGKKNARFAEKKNFAYFFTKFFQRTECEKRSFSISPETLDKKKKNGFSKN